MKCADARAVILSADHNALRDRTDPTLRQHLESCSTCAVAASHVIRDVSRLRAALIARGARAVPLTRPRRSRTKRVAMTLIPIALAAELAAFALIGNEGTPNPLLDRNRVIDDSVTSMLPAANSRVDTGEVTPVAPKKSRESVEHGAAARDSARDEADSTLGMQAPSESISSAEMAQLQVVPTSRG
jgi:hypothetical protein